MSFIAETNLLEVETRYKIVLTVKYGALAKSAGSAIAQLSPPLSFDVVEPKMIS